MPSVRINKPAHTPIAATLLAAMWLCVLPLFAHAAEYTSEATRLFAEGERHFTAQQPDYVTAKKWYEDAAAAGHDGAMLRLGFLNAESHFAGLTPDLTKAEAWFKRAAKHGGSDYTPEALFRTGNFYQHYKKPPDYVQAFHYISAAAQQHAHKVAMFDLARMYLDGKGTTANTTEGMTWLTKAAEAGLPQAQIMLAEVYTTGKYVPASPAKALKWTLAVAAKPSASVFQLNAAADMLFDGGNGLPKNYPAARGYYERAAAKGDAHAAERLVRIYTEGLGVPADAAKAAQYKAALKPQ